MIYKLYNTGSLFNLKYCQLLSVCSLAEQSVVIYKLYNTGSLFNLKYCQLLSVYSLTEQSVVIYIWWLWFTLYNTDHAARLNFELVLLCVYDGETDAALVWFSTGYTESQNNRKSSAENPIYFMNTTACYIWCRVWYECKKDQWVSLSMRTCLNVWDHIPFPARHCNHSDQKQFCFVLGVLIFL
jgi:hypothetical protein